MKSLDSILKSVNVKPDLFSKEELELLARGGYQVTDSHQNSLIESSNSSLKEKRLDESFNASQKVTRKQGFYPAQPSVSISFK